MRNLGLLREVHTLAEYDDHLTPEQHAELDIPLLDMCHLAGKVVESPLIAATLLCIVVRSGGLQMKAELYLMNECLALCENNLELRKALDLAASERSFRRIRRLGEWSILYSHFSKYL